MRTIKFRGKRSDNEEWAHGSLTSDRDRCYISESIFIMEKEIENEEEVEENGEFPIFMDGLKLGMFYPVKPETVGQFTGLTDKNRKEIYEGDVIEFTVNPSFYINAKLGDRYIIEYYGAGFFMKPINWKMRKIDAQNYVGLLPPYQTSNMSNHYEVIGNLHENPELL